MKQLLLITLLSIGSVCTAASQDYLVHAQFFGVSEGLSHRDVQCIQQDDFGFMWFGTRYGLNRFDGYHFEWFTQEKHGLQSNSINHMLKDSKGRLWLFDTGSYNDQTTRSIDIFDPKTHEVQSFTSFFGKTAPFKENEVIALNRNEKGQLVFITKDQRLHIFSESFASYTIDLGEFHRLWDIRWGRDGNFWIPLTRKNTDQCMVVYSREGQLVQEFCYPSEALMLGIDAGDDEFGRYIYAPKKGDKNPIFYRVSPSGQREVDTVFAQNFSQVEFDFSMQEAASLIRENDGKFWIAHNDDFLVIPEKGLPPIEMKNEYPQLRWVTDLFFDQDKTAWVSTQFGVYHFELRPSLFRNVLHQKKKAGEPENFACRAMQLDKYGQLWVAVENQTWIWNVNLNTGEENRVFPTGGSRYALGMGRDGRLLFNTTRKIAKGNPVTGEIEEEIPLGGYTTPNPYLWTIHQDKKGRIWMDGIGNYKNFGYTSNEKLNVMTDWFGGEEDQLVYQFLESDSDTAWVATSSGLFSLDLNTGQMLNRFWKKGQGEEYLPFDNIHHIHREKENGSFWLATAGYGLVHWHPKKGVLERFTRADGLPDNTLYAIYEDRRNNFWMSSNNGIVVFNKNTHMIRGYTEKEGLSHHEFNRLSHLQDEAGNIYFGGLDGVTIFHPDEFVADTSQMHPPMVITEFQQFDAGKAKLVDRTTSLRQSNRITLSPADRFFRLEFALLTFDDTDNIQYAYKVKEVDTEWTYQQENSIRLSRLPYGEHVLCIRGQSPDGRWSDKDLRISVVVLKPFYLQNWFLSLAILSFLLAGYGLYKWRVRSLNSRQLELEGMVAERTSQILEDKKIIEKQAEELKVLEKMKSRFFANVSHELRTPLTLMLGPVNSLLKRSGKNENDRKLLQFIQRNGQQLQKLINEILDLSKLESNKLEIIEEPVRFYTYLQDQLAQFKSYAASDSLSFEFDFQADESLKVLLDKNKFEKIIHNFLSNAMKFTPPEGEVTMVVKDLEGQLQVSVRDTGRGIHPDDLPHIFDRFYQSKQADARLEGGTGIGLALCKEMAELLEGKVWAESEIGAGSVFYFRFPKKEVQVAQDANNGSEASTQPSASSETGQEKMAHQIPNGSHSNAASILVVEDNPDLREYLQYLLSDYQVMTADNGKTAIDRLEQSPDCQLIISDLMMPVMDGFQLLEKLKSDDRWRHLPTIMLTAKVNPKAKLQALRTGVDDYLTKPFQEEELIARIENLLHNYHERMEVFLQRQNAPHQNDDDVTTVSAITAQVDTAWLMEVEEVFGQHISDVNFNLDFATSKLNISRRQFQRRIKQLTGLSPHQYLREMRLKLAYDYLQQGQFRTIKEVCFAVGFTDARYFSEIFKKRFGIKPSSFRG